MGNDKRWQNMMVAATCSLCLMMVEVAGGDRLRTMSFSPPFTKFNARGDRTVPSWTLTSSAVVKQSFARITHDMTNDEGSMYTRITTNLNEGERPEFSLAMTFRVSGDNEKHHGKSLALLVGSPEQVRRKGPTFGFVEDFVGVGVVITSKAPADMSEPTVNDRAMGPRQFVSFFANNGTRTTKDVRVLANSCASTIRYGQTRDDFNFLKSSRVRLGYLDGEVTLEVDARNIGVWRKCISTKVDDMPANWLTRAGLAIAGQTGTEVSNNNDVMSVEVYNKRDDAFDKRVIDGTVVADEEMSDEDTKKAKRAERLMAIHAHMEHEFDSVERILKDSLAKLSAMNDDMEKRLEVAEKSVNKNALSFLNSRVKDIEERVKMNAVPALEHRLKGVEDAFTGEMGDTVETMLSKNKGWRAPFALVFLLLVGMVVAVIQQYRKLMRSNYIGAYR